MVSLILSRWIRRNWNCTRPAVRQISSSSSSSSAATATVTAPWLKIKDSVEDDVNMFYNFFNVADKTVEKIAKDEISKKGGLVVGSSHGWLALYKQRTKSEDNYDLLLHNPLSHRSVNLPSIETLSIPTCTDFISIFELNRPKKVILSCSPDDENECRAIMSFGPDDRLAFCCPGLGNEWTPIGDLFHENDRINEEFFGRCSDNTRVPRFYEDFVYSTRRKKLFCATKFDNFESWDLADIANPKMNWKTADDDMDFDDDNYPWTVRSDLEYLLKKDFCSSFKYLVFAERSDRLFLVRRNVMKEIGTLENNDGSLHYFKNEDAPYLTIGFDVHELIVDDPKKGELRYMNGELDGMAFFIGSTGHGVVVEDEQKGVEPDSIYFTDPKELTPDPYEQDLGLYGGHDLGIFNYRQRTFSTCYYPRDPLDMNKIDPTPTWFTPSPN
ncbi:hypothetical protein MIMGU_mgv11b020336mg [Erythranthe guttata]|uniref:KIB1-4 beta-propeller domain-containing protein n=1 Tax=Erythranthe guttata TaxID=4155 RepID=A0A022RXP7_ERYGU|nr:PREDICTED: uncharacterized protein LOC105970519 [Erythranthe guttata]EYU44771.1 hypothetical protein MIMGU_mgv11b020336mg [Erythranthe guttata]|eukprot:XP_012850812.1 PREDICTED: uncharacterized protein LOC105970519 [Erythranthe guttata]